VTAVLADLSRWELFSTTLEKNAPGYSEVARKIENLRIILARYEEDE
jgi:hypothetical protein